MTAAETPARAAPDWAKGDDTGLLFPAHQAALTEGAAAFLTQAFHAAGTLPADNAVARVTELRECPGGSTGRKAFLSVAYEKPGQGLLERLFVKFSRDFDNPIRDRNRDQLEPEVRFAAISRHPAFPITVPACLFGDYHHESGTGILITERIAFGTDGIAPHQEKCLDYELPDALAHYRAVITANARLAAAHQSGHLGADLDMTFPYDPAAAAASDPIRYDARQIRNRLSRLAGFAEEFPNLLPPHVSAPCFIAQLMDEMPAFLDRQTDIKHFLTNDRSMIALCHWNANIDNGWFWHGGDGTLHCGLMDWGRVGQMNMALALWGTLSGAEPEMLDAELDELLELFLREFAAHGGPLISLALLKDHMFLYVATMGMAWLLDAPPLIRAQLPDLAPEHDRFNIRFKENETARTQLHMLTNVLSLWQRHGFGAILGRIPAT
jgi:hypothetical protein